MIRGMSALIAILNAGRDSLILRIRTQGLRHSVETLIRKARIRDRNIGGSRHCRIDIRTQKRNRLSPAILLHELIEVLGRHLIVVEQLRLEVRTVASVIRKFNQHFRRQLALNG